MPNRQRAHPDSKELGILAREPLGSPPARRSHLHGHVSSGLHHRPRLLDSSARRSSSRRLRHRQGVFASLQESARSIGGSASRTSLRKFLLIAEIALTVILLVSAGLLFKSFLHLRTSDLGSATDRVLTIKYGLPEKQYDTRDKVIAFHESLLERVRRLPGVRAAALISTPPGGGYEGDYVFTIPEHPSTAFNVQNDALYRTIDPGYFTALQIPLISGRFFTDQERLNRDHYVIISKKFADQFLSGDNPIGRHLNLPWNDKLENFEIIGVVGDTLYDVAEPVKATIYFPILSGIPNRTGSATIVVRTATEACAVPAWRASRLDPIMALRME